jgi:hypothetical protein
MRLISNSAALLIAGLAVTGEGIFFAIFTPRSMPAWIIAMDVIAGLVVLTSAKMFYEKEKSKKGKAPD